MVLLYLASTASTSLAESKSWKLGLLLCLSGECANDGTDAVRGIRLAAQEINANGGVLGRQIKLVIQDTNEAISGAQTVSAYRQMRLDPELQYFIGPSWTPAGLALAPIVAREHDIILMSPSLGAAEFHSTGANLFNLRGTDEKASRREAAYAYQKGFRRAAILSSQQPWESQQADFFEDEFKKLGGKVLLRQEPLPTVVDIKAEVLKIVHENPELVFISSVILMAQAARELRELRYAGSLIGSNIDLPRIRNASGALEGSVFFAFQKPRNDFLRKYKERFNNVPVPPAAIAYDVVYTYKKAIEKAASFDTKLVKKELLDVRFDGASGQIALDDQGCVVRELLGWKVVGKSFKRLS